MILTTGGVIAIAAVGFVHAVAVVREGGALRAAPLARRARELEEKRAREGRARGG